MCLFRGCELSGNLLNLGLCGLEQVFGLGKISLGGFELILGLIQIISRRCELVLGLGEICLRGFQLSLNGGQLFLDTTEFLVRGLQGVFCLGELALGLVTFVPSCFQLLVGLDELLLSVFVAALDVLVVGDQTLNTSCLELIESQEITGL